MGSSSREAAHAIVDTITCDGCTALCAGLLQGVDLIRKRVGHGVQNRAASVLLLTDRQANCGYQTASQIQRALTDSKFAEAMPQGFSSSAFALNKRWQGAFASPAPPTKSNTTPKKMSLQPVRVAPVQNQKATDERKGSQGSLLQRMFCSRSKRSKSSVMNLNSQDQHQQQWSHHSESESDEEQQQMSNNSDSDSEEIAAGNPKKVPKQARPVNPPAVQRQRLPCSINTFGFGADHSEDLLQSIATGGGMYFFVEDNEQISEHFANCLGGLTSVAGQNVVLTARPACAEVHIRKCLNRVEHTLEGDVLTVELGDIQSEEQRDIVLECAVEQRDTVLECAVEKHKVATESSDPMLHFEVAFKNMMTGHQTSLTHEARLRRPLSNDIAGMQQAAQVAPNMALDVQLNRLNAAAAMEDAGDIAIHSLAEARSLLNQCVQAISESASHEDPLCQALVNDMQKMIRDMATQHTYTSSNCKKKNEECFHCPTHAALQ